jgi:hypothetical protein
MNFGSTSIFNLPDGNSNQIPAFINYPEQEQPKQETYYFRLSSNAQPKGKQTSFKAVLTPQPFGYTVKIGGSSYLDCINISITLQNGVVTKAKIGHIQSEPECGFGTLLENGKTVDFIKGALQFCKLKFPSLRYVELDDMSNIDCGISKDKEPPRHPEKPFSLPHFSIARTGKTWYENRFGAKLKDSRLYTKYRSAIQTLHEPARLSFEAFCADAQFTNEQAVILKAYYSPERTWMDFFNAIPKVEQCKALFNWLPSFIAGLVQNTFIPYGWVIDIENMELVDFELINEPIHLGGGSSRKTRRSRGARGLRFSNQWW